MASYLDGDTGPTDKSIPFSRYDADATMVIGEMYAMQSVPSRVSGWQSHGVKWVADGPYLGWYVVSDYTDSMSGKHRFHLPTNRVREEWDSVLRDIGLWVPQYTDDAAARLVSTAVKRGQARGEHGYSWTEWERDAFHQQLRQAYKGGLGEGRVA